MKKQTAEESDYFLQKNGETREQYWLRCFPNNAEEWIKQESGELHCCEVNTKNSDYGAAITACSETLSGELWAGNGEYSSQVSFCPYCGFKAKVPAPIEDSP